MPISGYVPPFYSSLGIRAMGRFEKQTPSYYLSTYRDLKIIFQQGNDIVSVLFDNEESSDLLQNVTIECYDTSGKRMLLLNEPQGRMSMYYGKTYQQVEINVADLPPGVYLVRAIDKNNKWSGKFVRLL